MQYIIIDLEATCWENDRNKTSEIIEIGAVKLNDKLEIIDSFSKFIRPSLNPILSEFCTNLTSITQNDVDNAYFFDQVMTEFENWILSQGNDILFCSWGFYDKKQIIKECKIKNYSGKILKLLDNHISLKHKFAELKKIEPCGMGKALNILGIPLEGRHHRGIDDAKNITKIFIAIFSELNLQF